MNTFVSQVRIWIITLDREALIFDAVGAATVGVFGYLVAGPGGNTWQSLPAGAALAMALSSAVILSLQLLLLIGVARKADSPWLRLVLSGTLVFICSLQPFFMSIGFFKLKHFIPYGPTFGIFAFCLLFIFGVMMGHDEKKGFDLHLTILGFATVLILGVSALPFKFDRGTLIMAATGALLFTLWKLLRRKDRLSGILTRFTENAGNRPGFIRLIMAGVFSLFIWLWWDLATASILTKDTGFGMRVWMLYLSGPLLYRVALISRPPVNPLSACIGLGVLLYALIAV